jgi:predicted DNA-binding transcriptional regulator AlpA
MEEAIRELLPQALRETFDRAARVEEAARKQALTPAEVEMVWGFNKKTLNQWRWQGRGPRYFKYGKLVLYRQQDVREYVERHLKRTSEQR